MSNPGNRGSVIINKEFTWFEGESFIDKSNELKITREPMPTPAVTP